MANSTLSNISWLIMTVILIIVSLFLMSFVLSSTDTDKVQAKSSSSKNKVMGTESPNIVTSGVARTVNGMARFMDSAGYALNGGIQSAASATAQFGKTIASGVQTGSVAAVRGIGSGFAVTGNLIGRGASFTADTVGRGAFLVLGAPGYAMGSAANASFGSLIRPSDHVEVPIIDPDSAELKTAVAALPPKKPTSQVAPQDDQGPQWPIHGRVTTEFGVNHWPFQHTHTGIDISNGHGAEIKPFRPGRVIEAVHSNRGLGNHVIVDHGNGVVSVYAHLASISVSEGQNVGLGTTLGREGTTGVSTGNHLHFEIRVHGQAANPRQFIDGQP